MSIEKQTKAAKKNFWSDKCNPEIKIKPTLKECLQKIRKKLI
jgi:hypothetical protein